MRGTCSSKHWGVIPFYFMIYSKNFLYLSIFLLWYYFIDLFRFLILISNLMSIQYIMPSCHDWQTEIKTRLVLVCELVLGIWDNIIVFLQEVKECAISCMGLVVSTFGDHLTAELLACLPVLVDRMGNEITRLTAVKVCLYTFFRFPYWMLKLFPSQVRMCLVCGFRLNWNSRFHSMACLVPNGRNQFH